MQRSENSIPHNLQNPLSKTPVREKPIDVKNNDAKINKDDIYNIFKFDKNCLAQTDHSPIKLTPTKDYERVLVFYHYNNIIPVLKFRIHKFKNDPQDFILKRIEVSWQIYFSKTPSKVLFTILDYAIADLKKHFPQIIISNKQKRKLLNDIFGNSDSWIEELWSAKKKNFAWLKTDLIECFYERLSSKQFPTWIIEYSQLEILRKCVIEYAQIDSLPLLGALPQKILSTTIDAFKDVHREVRDNYKFYSYIFNRLQEFFSLCHFWYQTSVIKNLIFAQVPEKFFSELLNFPDNIFARQEICDWVKMEGEDQYIDFWLSHGYTRALAYFSLALAQTDYPIRAKLSSPKNIINELRLELIAQDLLPEQIKLESESFSPTKSLDRPKRKDPPKSALLPAADVKTAFVPTTPPMSHDLQAESYAPPTTVSPGLTPEQFFDYFLISENYPHQQIAASVVAYTEPVTVESKVTIADAFQAASPAGFAIPPHQLIDYNYPPQFSLSYSSYPSTGVYPPFDYTPLTATPQTYDDPTPSPIGGSVSASATYLPGGSFGIFGQLLPRLVPDSIILPLAASHAAEAQMPIAPYPSTVQPDRSAYNRHRFLPYIPQLGQMIPVAQLTMNNSLSNN